jgi:hypothetical protein
MVLVGVAVGVGDGVGVVVPPVHEARNNAIMTITATTSAAYLFIQFHLLSSPVEILFITTTQSSYF